MQYFTQELGFLKMRLKSISYLYLLFLLTVFTSCESTSLKESEYDKEDGDYQESVMLGMNGKVTLALDSTTSPNTYMLQYLTIDNTEALSFWNRNTKSILFYDLESTRLISKREFDQSGPNMVRASSFTIHTLDSILLTDSFQTTYLTNKNSEIIDKYPVEDPYKIEISPGPFVLTGSPMTFKSNHLYYQGFAGGVFNQPIMVDLNLKTKEINYFSGYPDFYREAYWRGGYDQMRYTFNSDEGIFVYSFAADHFVRVMHLERLDSTEVYFASKEEFPSIKPPREKMSDPGGELDERKFMLQPSFGMIHYDKFNDLYYRFAYEGIPESDLDSGDEMRSTVKQLRIVILDDNFRKVGEYEPPRFRYNEKMSFVGKKGLHLNLRNEVNEDIMEFEILSPSILSAKK